MPSFALASELHRLSPDAIARVDHIIVDDGSWTQEQITDYMAQWYAHNVLPHPDDWTRPCAPLA